MRLGIAMVALLLASPMPAHAESTCSGNTLHVEPLITTTITVTDAGITFKTPNQDRAACGTPGDPWTLHVVSDAATEIRVDVSHTAAIDADLGPGRSDFTLQDQDPDGVDIRYAGEGVYSYGAVGASDRGTFTALSDMRAFLMGGPGDDLITGSPGEDHLYGWKGNDTLSGLSGSDLLRGGPGDDTLDGGADDDELRGGQGDDTLTGGSGQDSLFGEKGRDTIDARDGEYDLVMGGRAFDTATVDPGDSVGNVEDVE